MRPIGYVCFFGRNQEQSGHALLHCTCPLMTQSGHAPFRIKVFSLQYV
jgi:hypothetical protein